MPVSYTHLDVYKRQSQTTYRNILETLGGTMVVGREDDVCTTGHIRIGTATPEMPVSYTHLDVYKRQVQARGVGPGGGIRQVLAGSSGACRTAGRAWRFGTAGG